MNLMPREAAAGSALFSAVEITGDGRWDMSWPGLVAETAIAERDREIAQELRKMAAELRGDASVNLARFWTADKIDRIADELENAE